MHRYAISRELENLHLAFDEAKRQNCEAPFYNLLAMSQVLTIPLSSTHIKHSNFLRHAPKYVVFLPILVQGAVITNDAISFMFGAALGKTHAVIVLGFETLFLVALVRLAVRNYASLGQMDAFWADRWEQGGRPKRVA
jgi:hypothetical protein